MSMDELSEKWQERVQEELDPEEQVLWMGGPDPEKTAGRPLSTPAVRVGLVALIVEIIWLVLTLQFIGPPQPGQETLTLMRGPLHRRVRWSERSHVWRLRARATFLPRANRGALGSNTG